jgi:hypothetical protein
VAMSVLCFKAYLMLLYFDLYVAHGNFAGLYNKVRRYPRREQAVPPGEIERICSAVDLAAIWYWTEVLCLQRSAATVCLLRQRGVAAHMIIGVQRLPFKAHAWVEVEGRVVNDKPYMHEMYAVLDRC